MTDDPDVAAMLRLREGEDLALNEIMERWQRRLTSYLLRLTASESVALDLAEETFVRVYQGRERYRPTGKFSTWLFAIATNLVRHHARWKARHPAVSLDAVDSDENPLQIPSGGLTPDGDLEKHERAVAVRGAVQELPDDLREAVVLFEYEDMSYEEIAAVTGCSRKAVETRLYRARAILREKLRPLLS